MTCIDTTSSFRYIISRNKRKLQTSIQRSWDGTRGLFEWVEENFVSLNVYNANREENIYELKKKVKIAFKIYRSTPRRACMAVTDIAGQAARTP